MSRIALCTPSLPQPLSSRYFGALVLGTLVFVAAVALHAGIDPKRIALLLLLAPIVEESLFRAGLHQALLRPRVPSLLANGVTALVFGLLHALLHSDAAAFLVAVPALLIGVVYQSTQRVRDCALLHAALNALWLLAEVASRLPTLPID